MGVDDILATIGDTPHVRVNRLFGQGHGVWIKSERSNPGGSIKDRIALAMVEAAESSGALRPGGTIVEPTSGNSGIGLAMVAAVKGYKLVLVMPDSVSIERRRLMLAFGASFELTPREKGMKGSIARAQELRAEQPARRPARRRDPGRCRGRTRDGSPQRARGRHAGRHLQWRRSGRHRAEAAQVARGPPCSRLQLRHRRALPVDRRVPARLTPPMSAFVAQGSAKAPKPAARMAAGFGREH